MAELLALPASKITIIGRRKEKTCEHIPVPFKTIRFRMIFTGGVFFYSFFNLRLFFMLLFMRADLLIANDLDTLLPNYLVSLVRRIPLIYDSHEFFTEVPELKNRPLVKSIWTGIEKSILPHLKYMITVSDPIARYYHDKYGISPVVIRNFSKRAVDILPFSRKEINVKEDVLLAVIMGTGLNMDKGVEELVDAVSMTDNVNLLIIGSGDIIRNMENKVKKLGSGSRIRFIPAVPWDTMLKYTGCADVGMCLEKDTNLNYRYSLPNKLFNYISAGIAIVSSGMPEVKKLMEEYHFGICLDSVTPENISRTLVKLRDNNVQLEKLKLQTINASEIINWENEAKKAADLFTLIFKTVKKRN